MRSLALALVLSLAACGGDDGGPVAVDDYAEGLRDATCKFLVACGEVADLETCRAGHVPGDPHALSASERAALDGKRAAFDGKQAAACLDALAARSCDFTSQSFRVLPAACLAVTTGTVHGGAPCAQDLECISQTCNAPATCNEACCVGVCEGDAAPGFAAIGEACGGAGQCDPATAYCDQVALTCVALKPSGAVCESSVECAYGFDCGPGATCVALPELGDSCTGACRDAGTTCNAASHTCVKVGLVGDPCDSSTDCSPLYQCTTNKQCSDGVPLGQPCTRTSLCAGRGAFCDVADGADQGTCVTPKAAGATCTADADCDTDFCDPHTLTCQPQTVCLGNQPQPAARDL
ncbi:MAG TPA: hypothetical protein VFP84_06370 [Kofleriaceae bacterium]|nr:hypothetical protein [Kofleriaceae bacterium]